MKAKEESRQICAVCHQYADKPCVGRLTGRQLTYWHLHPDPKPVINVTAKQAELLQEQLEAHHKAFREFPGDKRRHDGTKAGR